MAKYLILAFLAIILIITFTAPLDVLNPASAQGTHGTKEGEEWTGMIEFAFDRLWGQASEQFPFKSKFTGEFSFNINKTEAVPSEITAGSGRGWIDEESLDCRSESSLERPSLPCCNYNVRGQIAFSPVGGYHTKNKFALTFFIDDFGRNIPLKEVCNYPEPEYCPNALSQHVDDGSCTEELYPNYVHDITPFNRLAVWLIDAENGAVFEYKKDNNNYIKITIHHQEVYDYFPG